MGAPGIGGTESRTKNKFVFGGDVLLDLTADTVTPQTLAKGKTAHDASGKIITGVLEPAIPTEADINFYDYDGTLLYAWTLAELAGKTELPPLPSHEGLICQGWNWTLSDLKATNRMMNVGAMYITDDGTTRIYIHLEEGRTSPVLGVCPNGTVSVDWGDGTEPDTLTGTSTTTVQWTPRHNYAAAGDYVIRLTVNGSIGILGYSNIPYLLRYTAGTDGRNAAYANAIQKVEIGSGVEILRNAFAALRSLATITIPASAKSFGAVSFYLCSGIKAIVVPTHVTSVDSGPFDSCYSITVVSLPKGMTSMIGWAFNACYALRSITIAGGLSGLNAHMFANCRSLRVAQLPDDAISMQDDMLFYCCSLSNLRMSDNVISIGDRTLSYCTALRSIELSASLADIGVQAFAYDTSLQSITIPANVKTLGSQVFQGCTSMAFVEFKGNVETIGANAFNGCTGVAYYDFTHCTAVPTLADANVFTGIPDDCEIRVPAALYTAWKAATNWATYADHLVSIGPT